jgi:signal transduction histidine kinase
MCAECQSEASTRADYEKKLQSSILSDMASEIRLKLNAISGSGKLLGHNMA